MRFPFARSQKGLLVYARELLGWGLLVSLHVIVTTASECLGFYPNDEIKGVMLHSCFWKTVSGLKKKKRLIEYCF